MQLVFDNCLKFNGEDTSVGKICKSVRDEFKRLYDQLNIEFYLNWRNWNRKIYNNWRLNLYIEINIKI